MKSAQDVDSDQVDRRAALALIAGSGMALRTVVATAAQAQAAATFSPPQVLNGADVRVFPADIKSELKRIAPNVYAFVQQQPPGWSNFNISNCGLVAGSESVLAVDAAAAPMMAGKFLAAALQATGKQVKRIVLTHFHGDHTAGLQFFEGAEIIAHEKCRTMMARLVGQPKPANWAKRENWAEGTEDFKPMLPSQTYSDRLTYYLDDTAVELIYPGPAHTDGDTLIYLPKQKILFMGDIAGFGVTPLHGSGYASGVIKVCDQVLAMDVETIVPGHGPVGGKAELAEMRGYFMLLQREGKKRFDAGMSAGRAAAEIDLGKFRNWADSDRVATNMARMYAEFSGKITSDQDFGSFIKAREEYTAITGRRYPLQ